MILNKKKILRLVSFVLISAIVFIGILSGEKSGLLLFFISVISFIVILSFRSFKLIKLPAEIKLYLSIAILSVISSLFALDLSYALDVLWKIIASSFIFLFFFYYTKNLKDIYYLIHAYLFSSFALALYNIINYQESIFRELPYGGVNPVALIMFSSITLLFLLVIMRKKKAYLLLLPPYLYLLFLTQSQKSILSLLLMFVVFITLILIYTKTTIFIKYFAMGAVILFLGFYILKESNQLGGGAKRTFATIESIYTGKKIEGAAGGITGEGLRADLKNKGWEYFSEKPFFGYGINNFRVLYGKETGLYTYSHFTPIELGIGYGFFGIILYYLIYFLLLKKSLRKFVKYRSTIFAFLFSYIIALIVIGFFMQTYIDPTVCFLLMISSFLVNKNNLLLNEKEKV